MIQNKIQIKWNTSRSLLNLHKRWRYIILNIWLKSDQIPVDFIFWKLVPQNCCWQTQARVDKRSKGGKKSVEGKIKDMSTLGKIRIKDMSAKIKIKDMSTSSKAWAVTMSLLQTYTPPEPGGRNHCLTGRLKTCENVVHSFWTRAWSEAVNMWQGVSAGVFGSALVHWPT